MIDIEDCVVEFVDYCKKFDMTEPKIIYKFHHTFRVMSYCKDIARGEGLTSDGVKVAMLCGLLHDIGRFEQYTKYKTFYDIKSVDHGDLSEKILKRRNYIKKYVEDKKLQKVILTAVRNHNKYKIEDNLDPYTLMMCRIVRDADKIDILKEQVINVEGRLAPITDEMVKSIKSHKQLKVAIKDETLNVIMRELSFIYDVNYKTSFSILNDENIAYKKLNLLLAYSDNQDKVAIIEKEILDYIEKNAKK